MDTVIVLFNRDLRVHDHPALAAACAEAERVVPLFVLDPAIPAGRRGGFLAECLADLRGSLRERGGDLVVRRGDTVTEAMRLAGETSAEAIYASADVSRLARRREGRLAGERIAFRCFPGVTVVPPGALYPSGENDHYRVFTPYWRAWSATGRRSVLPPPARVPLPAGLAPGQLPPREPYGAMRGGESLGRERAEAWLRSGLAGYEDGHDDLAGDRTSRLSPYLRFGCVSPLELAAGARGNEPFLRQLCWRDFHHQVTYAFPDINRRDYRPRGTRWAPGGEALDAWREGRTGMPIVDAGMRQLLAEGWMHNRARLITGNYLVKHLGVDWRAGLAHFFELLLDGDVANNSGNWQWVAGTGNDTRPNRTFNPLRQADRFDPAGEYVRRYVPELAGLTGREIHRPWRLADPPPGYPALPAGVA
ncbi:deoxyribodipyrimidine photo-lyase [Microtetraspora sp. NBRC 13810]|uniref:cryptochrome/photolyase family protein n=1 Tax=Microtetraspora sp. NBRC 13810 TaxID=3030990 RepID=UPI0024A31A4C|nr:deoxyribodipyrimidine photo-lyase [Microtetraspora sp. NBRC 13810]GLW10751.1 deoxyribodipyrimidine photo-lyase [Microtetraspora sp. NBRC 13810]